MSKIALIAVGGNSLIRAGEKGTVSQQIANSRRTSKAIAGVIRAGYNAVVTHGNGPQVGAALLRSERASDQVYEHPLDICVATTQGEIGYILQQALFQELAAAAIPHPVATVVSQVIVDKNDPAFWNPSKPIGPFYSRSVAEEKKRLLGWEIVEDADRGYRRIVPSPEPMEIIEQELIRMMVDQGILVIALGGGGIPVTRENGVLRGVEAVIDKDRASALLASKLGAEVFIISTDAPQVYLNFKKPAQRGIDRATSAEMRRYYQEGHFPAGNMGPKVESALRFLENGGKEVVITSNEYILEALAGNAGTHIVP